MDQISTSTAWNAIMTSLMAGQTRENQLGAQLSSGYVASDLKGYGANAETLSAMQAANTQVSGYITQTQLVGGQLAAQDTALQQVASSASAIRNAVGNAVATGDGSTLMSALQAAFQSVIGGLNTTYNGQYLFSGGQSNTQPVAAKTLADLTAAPSLASVFQNGQFTATAQIDPNTTISTGVLADQVGTPLFTVLQNIEAFDQGPNGPFSGTLTAAQSSFLTSQLATLGAVGAGLNDVVAQNGQAQSQVDSTQTNLTNQQTMLSGFIGDLADANLAEASVNLQQAQLSMQATGQVLLALKSSSLLNLLSATPIG
ncbi:MAG: flagellin [Caulobacteraceae bacterium]|nr:flagellin [Caulobacteraceae bacterium]